MIKLLIGALMLLTVPSGKAAEVLTKSDFAYGYKIEFKPGQSLYQVEVPDEVYKKIVQPNLSDLRFYNGKSELVPHQKLVASGKTLEKKTLASKALPSFAMKNDAKKVGGESIKIQTDGSGTIVEVNSDSKSNKAERGARTFVIDASKLKRSPDYLLIDFTGEGSESYFRKVSLAGSNDLSKWTNILAGVVLAKKSYQGRSLKRNRLNIRGSSYKYYRLKWSQESGKQAASISAKASFLPATVAKFAKPKSMELVGEFKDLSTPSFIYNSPGFFPVHEISIQMAQESSVAEIVVFGRAVASSEWSSVWSGTIFSAVIDGTILENESIRIYPQRYKHWKIEVRSPLDSMGKKPPKVTLNWYPEKLLFLARGPQPFLFAYGNAKMVGYEGIDLKSQQLSKKIGQATATSSQVLGGDTKLSYEEPKIFPWKTYLLWTILIGGVLGLGFMAKSMLKSLKEDQA